MVVIVAVVAVFVVFGVAVVVLAGIVHIVSSIQIYFTVFECIFHYFIPFSCAEGLKKRKVCAKMCPYK